MTSSRKTLFISDIHLDESHPLIAEKFIHLLQNLDTSVDALYILGDLFEAWIGDDDLSLFHVRLMRAMRAACDKGCPIYFMRGNRDFLIGKSFAQASSCILLADEEKINLYGTPILLMHGDTLCTQDLAYLRARKWMHQSFLQFMFKCLPLSWRRKIADKMRAKSSRETSQKADYVMDVTASEVDRLMNKYQVQVLIHGHTHKPDVYELAQGKQRIVLAAWHEYGSVLEWDEDGKVKVKII